MKNEPWIDRVYRDNLQTREVKLDTAHWLQVEKLIVDQERQKKKRKFLFWMLLATGLSIISFGSFQYLKPLNSDGHQNGMPPSELLSPAPSEEGNSGPDTVSVFLKPVATIDKRLNDLSDIHFNRDLNITPEIEGFSENYQSISKRIQNSKNKVNDASNYFVIENHQNNIKGNKVIDVKRDPKSIKQENVNSDEIFIDKSEKLSAAPNKQHKFDIAFLDKNYPSFFDGNMNIIINTSQFNPIRPIKVHKSRWAEKGIRTTLAQESNAIHSGTTISQAGLELYFHRSINKNLFYGLSAGYLSNFNKVHYAQVLTEYKYQGFGAQVNNYGIKPNWLQYGFIQLSGGIEMKKHRLMMGARPEFLFATKGKLDQIEFSDPAKTLSSAQISGVNQGWLQNSIMNKVSLTAYLGYEFRIMERVGLGIQINHVLKSPYKPLQGGIVQSRQTNWNTGFRLSYILK